MEDLLLNSLAASTFDSWNGYIASWAKFALSLDVPIVPAPFEPFVVWVRIRCVKVTVPSATISNIVCAINALHLGITPRPTDHPLWPYFRKAITRTEAKEPSVPRRPVPIRPLIEWCRSLPPDEELPLITLRRKTIVVTGITAAARHSDLANPTVAQTHVADAGLQGFLQPLGTKTDTHSLGQVILLHGTNLPFFDVLATLRVWLARTAHLRGDDPASTKLFISVKAPHQGLPRSTIARDVRWVLNAAGLHNYEPAGLRAGAIAAGLEAGFSLEQLFTLGRWRSWDTFMAHYARVQLPANFAQRLVDTALAADQPCPGPSSPARAPSPIPRAASPEADHSDDDGVPSVNEAENSDAEDLAFRLESPAPTLAPPFITRVFYSRARDPRKPQAQSVAYHPLRDPRRARRSPSPTTRSPKRPTPARRL
jgi:hypothetical protein